MSLLNKKGNKIKFGKYSYQINFEKLREICLSSTNDLGTKEIQIVQTYDFDERDEVNLSQKIEHETKTLGGNQNGMIYEILKLLIISLLENGDTETEFSMTFGLSIAINTLLEWGIIEEIK